MPTNYYDPNQNPYTQAQPMNTQYMPPIQPMQPPQNYSVPYMPQTQPINPTVQPAIPVTVPLPNNSVIIAPKKPPKNMHPLTFKSLFLGILIFALVAIVAFLIGSWIVVDTFNPITVIVDFIKSFPFKGFFSRLFSGQISFR